MRSLAEVLDACREWRQPAGGHNPFKLGCRLEAGATRDELDAAPDATSRPELHELWSTCREAWLFEDSEYGQWGLHLLSPAESSRRTAAEQSARPDDVRADDVVVGEFLGDTELLVLAPSEAAERRYLVALPMDPRADWYAVGSSAAEFLERYLASDGEKFWEQRSS